MSQTPEQDVALDLLYGSSEYGLGRISDEEPIELSEGVRRVYLDLLARSEGEIAYDTASLLCAAGEEAGIRYFIKFAKTGRSLGSEAIVPHRLTEEETGYALCARWADLFVNAGGSLDLAHELLRALLRRVPGTWYEMYLPTVLELSDIAQGVRDDILNAVLRAQAADRASEVANLAGALGRFFPNRALSISEWLAEAFRRGAPRLLEEEIGEALAMARTQQARLLAESFASQPDIRKAGETALQQLTREFELEEMGWEGRPPMNDRWSAFSWRHPSVPSPLVELLDQSAQGDGPQLLKALEQLRGLEAKGELWAQHPYMPHDRAHGFLAEAAFLHQRQTHDPQVYLAVCQALLETVGPRRCSTQLKCALLDGPSEKLANLIEQRLVCGLDAGERDHVAPLYPALAKLRPQRAWALIDRLRDPEDRPLNPQMQLAQGLAIIGGVKAVALLRAMVSHESASVMAEAEMALEDLGEASANAPETGS